MVLIYVTHPPFYALLTLQTASTHTLLPFFSWCGRATPTPIFSSRVQDKMEREREGRERKREQESGNKMYSLFLRTFTKSGKCPLFVCILCSSLSLHHNDCSYEYNTAFFFFLLFLCLLDRLRLERGTTAPEGEEGREEGREG